MNPDNWIEITKEEFETLRGVNWIYMNVFIAGEVEVSMMR